MAPLKADKIRIVRCPCGHDDCNLVAVYMADAHGRPIAEGRLPPASARGVAADLIRIANERDVVSAAEGRA